ncbi:MAG: CrcB protein [Phenylobacterium sp.]|nr:CrcB protein [Phenylobacterium sp.]
MLTYLWIALGSALGGVARYALSMRVAETLGGTFPWGVLLVNVSGSFAIGLFAAIAPADGRWALSPDARLFVTVGLCGGYTTFSSFSLQTLDLIRTGHAPAALGNVAGSVGLCLLAVWAGAAAGALINPARAGL